MTIRSSGSSGSLARLNSRVIACRMCPRLVAHREATAKNPPARFRGQKYWGRPIAGFGDPQAKILIVGLAPAANGGNRTGRIFTGDRSGDWLFETLYTVGLANQKHSVSVDDGLKLYRTYISAAVRCAPPANKPVREEFENCRPYLAAEMRLLRQVGVVVALGLIGYDAVKKIVRPDFGKFRFPKFGHGVKVSLPDGRVILCSYHPSQQNTFTGKLTRPMFRSVFRRAVRIAGIETRRMGLRRAQVSDASTF